MGELAEVSAAGTISAAAERVARVAGQWAEQVDADARFPAEMLAELRACGLLGALVPERLGGGGASVADLSAAVVILAGACGSSGLVLAMHQIQVAMILGHASQAALDELLPRLISGELLLANANSEVGLEGNRRTSICALEPSEGGFFLDKQASTVSFGEYADAVLASARRTPDSTSDDQVLAVCLPPQLTLEPRGEWNTLGMRGTCSRPCHITAQVPAELVIGDYADVFARTSLPVSTVLLSSVWVGLAEAAGRRAHASVRAQARKSRSQSAAAPPPSALRLAELVVVLHQMREVLAGGCAAYERAKGSSELETLSFSARMDNLKLSVSTLVIDVVHRAMAICGLRGYANDSDFSIGRLLRDASAAPLMVNNDRALYATAQTLLVRKEL
jgi:acyl-CoA dehydrogenase